MLPFEIREAVVQVSGKAFWLKDPLRAMFATAGVPHQLFDRYADESKFKIARHILADLDGMGDDGALVQRRIVTELCKLRNVPDPTVPDRDAALAALKYLKDLALAQKFFANETAATTETRIQEAKRKQAAIAARAEKMEQLRSVFTNMATSSTDPQDRGYGLEDLLAELFEVHEVAYRRPYRTANEQIDGHFEFKGFDYLVEARWRKNAPTESELAAFKRKVDKKLASTRGLFTSIVGFKADSLMEFVRADTSNILLMDGVDLALILEGRVSLTDALDIKVQKAAQEGIMFFPLRDSF